MATPTSLPASFSTGAVLTAAQMNDLRGAFRILQVVSATTTTQVTNNTSTFADTNLTATITPSATSSKVLVLLSQNGCAKRTGNAANYIILQLLRGATVIATLENGAGYTNTNSDLFFGSISAAYLDSPATTSATTYKTQVKNNINGAGVEVNSNSATSTITLMEVSA